MSNRTSHAGYVGPIALLVAILGAFVLGSALDKTDDDAVADAQRATIEAQQASQDTEDTQQRVLWAHGCRTPCERLEARNTAGGSQ
jgi:hypothetical protein